MDSFSLHELAAVFHQLNDAGWDAVLVGGQAVKESPMRISATDALLAFSDLIVL
jgi:hypothetical protein